MRNIVLNKRTFDIYSELIKNLTIIPDNEFAKCLLAGYDVYKIGYTDDECYYISEFIIDGEKIEIKKDNNESGISFGTLLPQWRING